MEKLKRISQEKFDSLKKDEKEFDMKFSNKFNIHRTRKNFPNYGIDTF